MGLFFLSVLVLLIVILLLLWLGRLRVHVDYRHRAPDDELSVAVRVLGCPVYGRRISVQMPVAATRERIDAGAALARLRAVSGRVLEELPLMEHLLRPFVFREMVWDTTIGTTDPPLTAILCGTAWGLKSVLLGAVSQVLHFRKAPELSVRPRFDGTIFQSDVHCIVVARLGQAMYAGWRLFLLLKKTARRA